MKNIEVIILAAGKGTRMCSDEPKVMQMLGGMSLLDHVLLAVRGVGPSRIHIVYGHNGQSVRQSISGSDINWVEQDRQLGTAHAVSLAMSFVQQTSDVLVVYGDVPFIQTGTLRRLVASAQDGRFALLSAVLQDPTGYGRIVRDEHGKFKRIVEEVDATESQKTIKEINAGFIAVPAALLQNWLGRVGNANSQSEYYLTDVAELAAAENVDTVVCEVAEAVEVQGVNNRAELAKAERALQYSQAEQLMIKGLTLKDPSRFDLRGTMEFGSDSIVDVNAVFEGNVQIGSRVVIGPNCLIRNSILSDDVIVEANSIIDGAAIGAGCVIGPFARLRPETELASNVRVGNFVEIKKSHLGVGSKANHLAYLGDSSIGKNVNIGAGVITCNYDGSQKHETVVEDNAFIGSDTQLVAPVKIGSGATIGAGSTIRRDAPSDKLTLTEAKTKTLSDWRPPNKKMR